MKQVLSITSALLLTLLAFGATSQTSFAETTEKGLKASERKMVATKLGKVPIGTEIGGVSVVETDLDGNKIAEYDLRQIAGKPDKETGDKRLQPGLKSVATQTQSRASQGTYCKVVKAWITKRSLLRVVRYRWYMKKTWCYNGYRVLRGSVSNKQWAANLDSLTNWHKNWLVKRGGFRDGGWRHWSKRQGKISFFIPSLGTIAINYPWIAINSRGNGSYSIGRGYS